MTAHHGTLWILKQDMLAHPEHPESTGDRLVQLKKGEIFEWRFESYNHFRTKDNMWFWVDDKTLTECCVEIATIFEQVRWKNKATTEEIWRLELFAWNPTGQYVYKHIKKEIEDEQIQAVKTLITKKPTKEEDE